MHEVPPAWKREFPVFGAVSGTVACLGAVEVVKLITGIGEPLAGEMLAMDLARCDSAASACRGASRVRFVRAADDL